MENDRCLLEQLTALGCTLVEWSKHCKKEKQSSWVGGKKRGG